MRLATKTTIASVITAFPASKAATARSIRDMIEARKRTPEHEREFYRRLTGQGCLSCVRGRLEDPRLIMKTRCG
jgi:hypothetical protein